MLRSAAVLLAFAVAAPAAFAAPGLQGRGVYYFAGSGTCPLAGVGTRANNACNRVSLEDGMSNVTVDAAHHKIKITSLSALLPKAAIAHDLFLFGVENAPQLASVKTHGLPKGSVIHLKSHAGKTELGVDGKMAAFAGGQELARDFLEFGFLGTVVKHQAETHLGK